MSSFAHDPISEADEKLGSLLLDAAFRLHRNLGPGLLESVYERCLGIELSTAGVEYAVQVQVPIKYEGEVVESALRLDMLVGNCVVVELKSVEQVLPIHTAQLFTYLKLTDRRLGFLINFNVQYLKDGIHRVVR
ncbi:hypothetical protein MalM25_12010 [Planctomycetes bacterium MalM25]|nr:hypothetical protein MalM25_12010 [Planctomycetes bacterium MalM25]